MTTTPAPSLEPLAKLPSVGLRTLQVGGGWFPERAGGLDRYFFELLPALWAAGVGARGLVVGSPAVRLESSGVTLAYERPDAPMLARWRALRRAVRDSIRADAPDVLVTHFAPYAFPLRRSHALPTVVHFHGPWAAESRREGGGRLACAAKAAIERAVYRRADRLIVLSRAFRDVLVADYGIAADRIAIVSGGVDCDRFAPAAAMTRAEARARLGWPTDRPIVLAVRRLAARMGLEMLIDAIAAARRSVPDVLCLIGGRGQLRDALAARIDAAGLSDHVRLLGFVPDDQLPLAYRAADVSVLPSDALEGFGLSAVESLAAGTPVLVTPVGGLPEVVERLSPSLIVEASVDPLSQKLAAMLRDPNLLPSDDACVTYARRSFDWTSIAPRVAEVYRRSTDPR